MIPYSFLSLHEIDQGNPSLDVDLTSGNFSWLYDVKNYSESLLIGIVAMKNSSHRLTFSDSFGSLACVVCICAVRQAYKLTFLGVFSV